MEPEEFWGKLLEVKDGSGSAQFEMLADFIGTLLSLPHANIDVERIFSSVNLVKTTTRNRLKTTTVRVLIKAKDGIKSNGGCVKFSPSSDLKKEERLSIYCSVADTDSDSDAD